MASVDLSEGVFGIEATHTSRKKMLLPILYRMWLDKGNGKYRAVNVTYDEIKRVHTMIGAVLAGARAKPPRSKLLNNLPNEPQP